MALYELSAKEILEKIRSREVSYVEVVAAFIERIKEVDPSINAIHQFYPDRILAEARIKDQDIAEDKNWGKLHELPISLKDVFYVPGFKMAGHKMHINCF